jgi:hypothetical protein
MDKAETDNQIPIQDSILWSLQWIVTNYFVSVPKQDMYSHCHMSYSFLCSMS